MQRVRIRRAHVTAPWVGNSERPTVKSVREVGEQLRHRAEELLRRAPSEPPSATTDVTALIYELQVHQVELQMQNEALRDAHHELEVSRERYRELYDLAPVAYFSLDGESHITEANEAAEALLGLPSGALAHERLTRFVLPEYAAVFERHRREVMTSGTRATCMLELVTDGGQQREVRVESLKSRRIGDGWRCMMIDVTDVHRLQRRLQQAQKLEAISALASGVAHEFNNILMGMLGCAEVALARIDPAAPVRAPVEQLKEVALRGRSVVAQLLSFGRRTTPQVGVVDLNAAIETSQTLICQRLGEGVKLQLRLDARDAFVPGDAAQIEQILLNLAGNAADAMAGGGELQIATRNCRPDQLAPEGRALLGLRHCIALTVSDTGTGMDADTQARALEPFFTTKPPGAGTGLGLAMVHAAVRQAGGYLDLRSRVGAGTVIELYWPQAMARTPAARSQKRQLTLSAGVTHALVVDDDELVRMGLRQYLQRAGCEVTEAANGDDALSRLKAESGADVQLLVADVMLPGMQGTELAAAAHLVRPDLAILFISAHAPELLVERRWLEPGMPVLQKPFTAEELQHAVADILSERAPATAE